MNSSARQPVSSSPGPEVSTPDPLTLDRLLQERLLRGSVVLAGGDRLDVVVQWCRTARDVLVEEDPLEGVAVIGDEAVLAPADVERLTGRGAAAVLLRGWTAERWQPAPPSALPVVGIPPETRLDSVARHVARLNLAHESHILRYAQTVHGALASLLHRSAGVDALCDLLARLSGCAVVLIGTGLDVITYAEGRHSWLDPTSAGAACRELLGHQGDDGEGRADGHDSLVLSAEVKDRPCTFVVAGVHVAGRRDGWLVLVDDTYPPHAHDVAEQRVAVQQASTIVGTELMRLRDVERAEERARGNFVHALLHGRFSNHADLVARSEHHDFPVESRFGAVVVQASGLIAEDDSPNRLAYMAREASHVGSGRSRRTMAAVVGDVIAVVREVGAAGHSGPDRGARELDQFAQALSRRLQSQTDRAVLVGYGRPVQGADAIAQSYREARLALGLSAQLQLTAPAGFSDLRVDSTLLDLAQQEGGRAFAGEMLAPLREASGDLEDAVRTYVEAGGNLNQAARTLCVHRNTMLYKIERGSKALDRDLREAETQFAVWLALKLDMLARTADEVKHDLDAG
ncbi:MAG TPA: helix-turn-helix domain-containing protein [Segeticoccus sp.]|nr:helix-turn-helix domain-containing protein [Segeticoccus sp.]